ALVPKTHQSLNATAPSADPLETEGAVLFEPPTTSKLWRGRGSAAQPNWQPRSTDRPGRKRRRSYFRPRSTPVRNDQHGPGAAREAVGRPGWRRAAGSGSPRPTGTP